MKIKLSVNSRGTVTLPLQIRKQLGIPRGGELIARITKEGVVLMRTAVLPVEMYSQKRLREFRKTNEEELKGFGL